MLIIPFIVIITGCKDSVVNPVDELSSKYQLCFNKWINNNWEVCLYSANTGTTNISNLKREDSEQSISPNGRYIVYTHFNIIDTDIYLYDIETGTTTDLTPGDEIDESQPHWTPDGKKIIYAYHQIGKNLCSYIMNLDGSGKKKIMDFSGMIFFLPDGYNFICLPTSADDETANYIYKANIDGSSLVKILDLNTYKNNEYYFNDFNPFSKELLLFTSAKDKSVMETYNIETGKAEEIYSQTDGCLSYPRYSNDYSKIVFTFLKNDNTLQRLIVYDIVSKTTKTLVELKTSEGRFDYNPILFSPNDKYVVYTKNVNIPNATSLAWNSYTYTVNVATGDIKYIDEGASPVWNPRLPY